jgi:hypothetical protein
MNMYMTEQLEVKSKLEVKWRFSMGGFQKRILLEAKRNFTGCNTTLHHARSNHLHTNTTTANEASAHNISITADERLETDKHAAITIKNSLFENHNS